jgi:hypothetical protein
MRCIRSAADTTERNEHYARMSERAVKIEVADLAWAAGAPAPELVATEERTLFSFDVAESLVTGSNYRRVAEFVGCTSVRFGFPNDEAQGGHPLYGKGLEFYSAHEVVESHWLSELRAIERHHPYASDTPFLDAHHYVLTFHDSTLEAVARDIRVLGSFDSDEAAWSAIRAEMQAR